ncbi:MAG: hypothetical protein HZA03_10560 [Nitrospinae bacterium]|nr:hypothetical protein [Nitrospinota bacterium]
MADKGQQTTPSNAIKSIVDILEALEESARKKVFASVYAYFQITPDQSVHTNIPPKPGTERIVAPMSGHSQPSTTQKDIRALKDEKQPKTAIEMATVMAYYLKELASDAERKEIVTSQDVEKYFVQAGFKLPKHSGQTLLNAKNAGYFDSSGEGQFKLNAVGHNLVAHSLPKSTSEGKSKSRAKKKPSKR